MKVESNVMLGAESCKDSVSIDCVVMDPIECDEDDDVDEVDEVEEDETDEGEEGAAEVDELTGPTVWFRKIGRGRAAF